jgi:hypothetical protein
MYTCTSQEHGNDGNNHQERWVQAEALEAQKIAEKERREADLAREKAEQRRCLYEISTCIATSDIAKGIAHRYVGA